MKRILAGLDVGTSKVCALVAEYSTETGLALLGYGLAPCAGLRKGVVVNIEATVEAIRAALHEAEKSAAVRIGAVIAGIAGSHIRGLNSHGIVAVRGGEVGSRDVERVIDAARAVAIPLDREVLHVLPQQFAVDDQEGVRDPVGMAGVRLEARIHIVTAAQSYSQNLARCCERAGASPTEMVFDPLAAAHAALFAEERELGVALVDIGGGTTGVIVFHGGTVMHTAVLPVGGSHVTADVAAGLRTPVTEAEQLKTAYGASTVRVVGQDESVRVAGVGGREPRPIARRLLAEIIGPRMEEILTLVKRELERSGILNNLVSGVVLVGGSSLLEGTQELAEQVFNLPIRRGLPINLAGMPEDLMKPMYASAAGLVLHGTHTAPGAAFGKSGRLGRLRTLMGEWVREFF